MNMIHINLPTIPLILILIGLSYWAGVSMVLMLTLIDRSKQDGKQPSTPDMLVSVSLVIFGVAVTIVGFCGIIGLLVQTK